MHELLLTLWIVGSYVAVGWICYVCGKRAERRDRMHQEIWENVDKRVKKGENAGEAYLDELSKHGYKVEDPGYK